MILICLVAGAVQGLTGFGMGVIALTGMGFLMPLTTAVAVLNIVCIPMNADMAWHRRKGLNISQAVVPAAFYLAAAIVAIFTVKYVPTRTLSLAFGVFLIILAFYFFLTGNKLKVKGGLAAAMVCGVISGLCDGFFGVGGPLMVLYYLAVTDTMEEYFADLAFTFLVCGFIQALFRIYNGYVGLDQLHFLIAGFIGVMAGTTLGMKRAARMDGSNLRKLIYVVIGLCGLITVVRNL